MKTLSFIITTYLLTIILDQLVPLSHWDLLMFVPGAVGIFLAILNKQRISTLFKLDSFTNLILGLMLPLIATIIVVGLSMFFSLVSFSLPGNLFNLQTFIFAIVIGIILAIGEEIGWRGYLLKNLKSSIPNFYTRALTVGLIWGLWHIPYLLRSGSSYPEISIFIINICLISISFTYLYEKNNSIWPTVIAHAVHNVIFNMLLPIFTAAIYAPNILFGEEGLLVTVGYLAVVLLIVRKRAKNYEKDCLSYN